MATLNGELKIELKKKTYLVIGSEGVFITVSVPAGSLKLEVISINSAVVRMRLIKKGFLTLIPQKFVVKKFKEMGFNVFPREKNIIEVPVGDFLPLHLWKIQGSVTID